MRGRHRRLARWLLALIAVMLLGGASMYRDDRPASVTRAGFTVFAVDQVGAQTPLAHFDGRVWRSPCENEKGSPGSPVPLAQISGLAGASGASLQRVRELTGDSSGWEPTADAVEAKAVAEVGLAGPRTVDPRVYSADAAGTGIAYVEVVVRVPVPAFRGIVASAWVLAGDDATAQLIDFRTTPFDNHAELVAVARQVPLGIVDTGHERVWVMGVRAGPEEDVRLVAVRGREAREQLRVARRGC
jgi:hypothetical protein